MIAGCDQGAPADQATRGPLLHVVSANIGPGKRLPADGVIQIAFDRPLLPSSVIRQSVVLRDGSGSAVNPPVITYDPVGKVVSISNPNVTGGAWLIADQPYKVFLAVAKDDEDGSGLRAIDRAPLDPAQGEICFTAGPPGATQEPSVRFCYDVLPVLQARCSGGLCHGGSSGRSRAAAGLVLETPLGIARTAVGRVAQGANTGPRAGAARPPGRVFGIDMPIIDPFNPGNSWLLYKLLLADNTGIDPGTALRPRCDRKPPSPTLTNATPAVGAPWSADDRAALGVFVTGPEMPYPAYTPTGAILRDQALTTDELQRIRAWISQGAVLEECGACEP